MFDFNVVPLSKQIWPKTWLLNFWAATGVPSLLNESFGTEPGNWTHWEAICRLAQVERATSATPRAQTHRSSSMALSWLNFFWTNKTRKKIEKIEPATSRWAGQRMWKLKNNMYWPGWWRHTELAEGHVAGSFFCVFFFWGGLKEIDPATRRWASNEALSQLRGTEPATREWWICTARDRWIFRCSLCSSNKSIYWLILAPYEIK